MASTGTATQAWMRAVRPGRARFGSATQVELGTASSGQVRMVGPGLVSNSKVELARSSKAERGGAWRSFDEQGAAGEAKIDGIGLE